MNEVIVFFEVEKSSNAAQGMSPSGKAGYEIWLMNFTREELDQTFLGWIPYEKYQDEVDRYHAEGSVVWVAPLEEGYVLAEPSDS